MKTLPVSSISDLFDSQNHWPPEAKNAPQTPSPQVSQSSGVNFTLKHLLLFEICAYEICEQCVYKHSETIE